MQIAASACSLSKLPPELTASYVRNTMRQIRGRISVRRRWDTMSDTSAWVGVILAVLILLGIVLEGLGLIAIEWLERRMSRLERRMSRKQKIAATAALLVVAVALATRGLLQIYGH